MVGKHIPVQHRAHGYSRHRGTKARGSWAVAAGLWAAGCCGQNSYPKGVQEHYSCIWGDSVHCSWKTELQHAIMHRHEAILIQQLQHSMQRGDGRSCASQRSFKRHLRRNARETHQVGDTARQASLYLRWAVTKRGIFHCTNHHRLAIRQQTSVHGGASTSRTHHSTLFSPVWRVCADPAHAEQHAESAAEQ